MREVTFHTEPWSACLPDISQHWSAHWNEVALHKDEIPLDPDFDEYARIEKAGQLHCSVARHRGVCVGYAVVIVRRHLHYKTSLSGYFDLYYLHPNFRAGWAGVRLFRHAEAVMRKRGVERLFTGTKVSLDASVIFKRLGWDESERVWAKLLKEH
jgi:GNAT superfamily N-acetyltransferase